MRSFWRAVISIALLLCAAVAAGQTTAPTTQPFSIFANALPMESAQFTPNDLADEFPAFKHADFDQSGFRAIVLPFLYSDPKKLGDPNETLAFSFLISNDIDWAPGSYVSRHAYFTFKSKMDRTIMQALCQAYDERRIILEIARWQANFALGGTISRSADGYSGELRIYDRHGRVALKQMFEKPRSYFDLLGDMDGAAIAYFGTPASVALAKFLHEPRCKNMSNIVSLGSAAFLQQDSPEEFGIYDKILRTDPDFAAVRYWSALRRWWANHDDRSYYHELALALKSRLEPEPLDIFVPASCPDKDLAAQFPAQVDRAEQLLGKDHPIIVKIRMERGYWGNEAAKDIIARGLEVAGKYPNVHFLVTGLGHQFNSGKNVPADYELAASLYTASVLDNYLAATALTKWDGLWHIALVCDDLGRPDISMECLSLGGPKQPTSNLSYMIKALCFGGRYDEALQYYHNIGVPKDSSTAQSIAPCAAFAAAVLNKPDELDQIIADHHDAFEAANLAQILHGYSDYLHGRVGIARQFTGSFDRLNYQYRWGTYLVTQLEADSGHVISHYCQLYAFGFPQDRLGWQAMDAFYRRNVVNENSAIFYDAAAFYDYLWWFYQNDPWVVDATADFRHRCDGHLPTFDIAPVKEGLSKQLATAPKITPITGSEWEHAATPWRVAAAIHQLVQNNQLQEAAELAALNNQVQVAQHWQARESLSFALMRKVDQARQSQ